MDLGTLLFLLIFLVLPLLELIGGKQRREQKKQQELERMRRAEAARRERDTGGGGAGESAADMVPADLWELLTGERRTGTGTLELPEEEPPETETFDDEYDSWTPEPVVVEEPDSGWVNEPYTRTSEEAVSLERVSPVDAPRVVSLEGETLEATAAELQGRHERFHERLDELPGPPAAMGRPGVPAPAALRTTAGLRQAVLLTEILGPPVGLRE